MKFWLQEIGRLARMVGAFAVCAFGIYLSIHANVGLAPWDAFAVGLAGITGKTYGLIDVYKRQPAYSPRRRAAMKRGR